MLSTSPCLFARRDKGRCYHWSRGQRADASIDQGGRVGTAEPATATHLENEESLVIQIDASVLQQSGDLLEARGLAIDGVL